jgi:hypothetical protein
MANTPISSNSSGIEVSTSVNGVIRDLQGMQTTQIFKDDSGTRRVLLGKGSDGFYGLKVSQEGQDVYTADNTDLVFNSDNNLFKIISTGEVSINVPDPFTTASSPLTATIPHGQSFTPSFLAYVSIPAGSGVVGSGVLTNLPAMVGGSGSITAFTQAGADDTNLYIYIRNNNGTNLGGAPFGTTWTFKYYILQETAA